MGSNSAPQLNGIVAALKAYGLQDKWLDDPSKFDGKKLLLRDQIYKTTYAKLDATRTVLTQSLTLCFHIQRQCDLINMLDLVIPSQYSINSVIRKIEVEFGGQRMDIMSVSEDIETQIKTNAALFGRTISHFDDMTFIPLTLAPLHANNLVFPSAKYHDLRIYVQLQPSFFKENQGKDIELYGCQYIVSDRYKLQTDAHDFITVQNQYTGAEVLKKGINRIKLNFNHPVYVIYFWGFEKDKVKKVRLLLNNAVFFEGSAAVLAHQKACRGFSHVDPMMLFLSEEDPGQPTKTTVNFSRIDNPILEIETEQEDETPVYVVGLNLQPLRYSCGMVGLVFSK